VRISRLFNGLAAFERAQRGLNPKTLVETTHADTQCLQKQIDDRKVVNHLVTKFTALTTDEARRSAIANIRTMNANPKSKWMQISPEAKAELLRRFEVICTKGS
jgi:hypothetical protein